MVGELKCSEEFNNILKIYEKNPDRPEELFSPQFTSFFGNIDIWSNLFCQPQNIEDEKQIRQSIQSLNYFSEITDKILDAEKLCKNWGKSYLKYILIYAEHKNNLKELPKDAIDVSKLKPTNYFAVKASELAGFTDNDYLMAAVRSNVLGGLNQPGSLMAVKIQGQPFDWTDKMVLPKDNLTPWYNLRAFASSDSYTAYSLNVDMDRYKLKDNNIQKDVLELSDRIGKASGNDKFSEIIKMFNIWASNADFSAVVNAGSLKKYFSNEIEIDKQIIKNNIKEVKQKLEQILDTRTQNRDQSQTVERQNSKSPIER